MGLFDFFKKRPAPPKPQEQYVDPILGALAWSEDDEAWAGERDGLKFFIAYGGQATPENELLQYARDVLTNPSAFQDTVERAKPDAMAKHPKLADEIAGLSVEAIHFYEFKNTRRILADLAGGQGDRSWRIEFRERDCDGIGFDT
jgi:hypothetical protein